MARYFYNDMEYENYEDATGDCVDDNFDDFVENAFLEVGYSNILNALTDNNGEEVYYRILDLMYKYADEYIEEEEEEDE